MTDELRSRVRTALVSITAEIGGDPDSLFERVYDELRSLAETYLRRERPDHTLQPTALVHEAYMRIKKGADLNARNAAHFRALAARIMRQLLIEHARGHAAAKRGGDFNRMSFATDLFAAPERGVEILELEEALKEVRKLDERMVQVVELRFYGGLTIEETAMELGVSETVVKGDWRTARALITRALKNAG